MQEQNQGRTSKDEEDEQFVLPPLKNIVTVKDAIRRYDASIRWIENHGHAIISNGVFTLTTSMWQVELLLSMHSETPRIHFSAIRRSPV